MDALYETIRLSHSPNLVIRNQSPNENIIYHLYFDGEITYQKGGWAYQKRTEFTDSSSLPVYNHLDSLRFPVKTIRGEGYIITTLEQATKIRNQMANITLPVM